MMNIPERDEKLNMSIKFFYTKNDELHLFVHLSFVKEI